MESMRVRVSGLPLFSGELSGLSPAGKPAQATPQRRCELVRSGGTLGQSRVLVELFDRRDIRPLRGVPELAVQPLDLADQDQDRFAGGANLLTRIARQVPAPVQKRLKALFVKSFQTSASVLCAPASAPSSPNPLPHPRSRPNDLPLRASLQRMTTCAASFSLISIPLRSLTRTAFFATGNPHRLDCRTGNVSNDGTRLVAALGFMLGDGLV